MSFTIVFFSIAENLHFKCQPRVTYFISDSYDSRHQSIWHEADAASFSIPDVLIWTKATKSNNPAFIHQATAALIISRFVPSHRSSAGACLVFFMLR
jgi:hypothetical protein